MIGSRQKRLEGGVLRQQILQKDHKLVMNFAFQSGNFGKENNG